MKTIEAVAKGIVHYGEPERLSSCAPSIFVGALIDGAIDGARPGSLTDQQQLNAMSAALSAALNNNPAILEAYRTLNAEAQQRIAQCLAAGGSEAEKCVAVANIIKQVFGII